MKELIAENGDTDKTAHDKILDHDLFNILSGHPQAISLTSTLIRDKSLLEIYNILNFIKQSLESRAQGELDREMLTLHLSFQASLVFLQSANHEAF